MLVKECELLKQTLEITPDEIQQGLAECRREQKAKQRIKQYAAKVRQECDVLLQEAQQIVAKAEITVKQQEKAWRTQLRQEIVAESITWLVEQAELEKHLVIVLQERIGQQVKLVLKAWCQKQNISENLVNQLTEQIGEATTKQSLVLSVSPEQADALCKIFAEQIQIRIRADFAPWQAELSSSCMILRFDLYEHLERLLETCVPTTKKTHLRGTCDAN
uniref:Type III secretion apparatus protein HrpE, YscL n=1 Tax=Arsenophonus nasoniae TaxID=638 RepID=D2TY29_9GAMM|nr:type III secretion apparatus protein HrpE, YscL [Arsenophonus nasoniae]